MFRQREQTRKWLSDLIERFRQKGAVSPDRAMTAEELGLPFGFVEAMKRRLGSSGIFVEVNGKYYLNEERLNKIEEQMRREEDALGLRNRIFTLRIVRIVAAALSVTFLLANIFIQSLELRVVTVLFIIIWLATTILQIYYFSRVRKRSNFLKKTRLKL